MNDFFAENKKGPALSLPKGFTIIELIVVIAVISVLAAIVLTNVSGYIQRAQNLSITVDVNTMMKAGTIYFSEHGSYTNFFNDVSYTNPRNALIQTYPDANPTERMTGAGDAYCVCYGLKGETGSNKHTLCADSVSYIKEMNYNKNCGWRCQTSGRCQD
jgi:prepilin-type N-terminal cleavage/methylation domain-containing protein